jgi:hypothetical protein
VSDEGATDEAGGVGIAPLLKFIIVSMASIVGAIDLSNAVMYGLISKLAGSVQGGIYG